MTSVSRVTSTIHSIYQTDILAKFEWMIEVTLLIEVTHHDDESN